jgi:ABC-type multidrug transport system ATPase subunit
VNIKLENAGKKFHREWIFRNLNLELNSSDSMAILGPNGSGKSTLLQMISGYMLPTEGTVNYFEDNKKIDGDQIFSRVSFASPYLELIEEFTLYEIVELHFRFKKRMNNYSTQEIIALAGLDHAKNKTLKNFSSGMKQRVKLALALMSDTHILLLDEPCSNFDHAAVQWYRKLIEQFSGNKIVVVCSNNTPVEFDFCKSQLNMTDWKPN